MLNLIDDDEEIGAGDSNKNQIELNLQTSPQLVEHYSDSTNLEKELLMANHYCYPLRLLNYAYRSVRKALVNL